MVNSDLLRIVDSISRDKKIEKELIFADIETAMASAVRKAYVEAEEVTVTIDRLSGQVEARRDGVEVSMTELGRIAAQTAKQVMIQKIREAERGSIFEEFSERKGEIITGTVSRVEGPALIVNLGRTEGFLPRSEQIPGESHHPGERIRALILDVREAPHQVKIVLSRTHPDLIRRLFELEVPEVAERIIEIKALAREAGYRTKLAVSSIDTRVDAVGACVGVRGSRIKNIVDELGGEKIDIVRWNESSQILISNSLKPAEVQDVALCFELGRATVVVPEDQLSLAIGKRGQNVRLGARLTGWDVDILTPAEYNKNLDEMDKTLKSIEGVEDVALAKLTALGIVSLMDVEEVGPEPLVSELDISEELAEHMIVVAGERAKELAVEMQQAKAAKAAEEAEAAKQAKAAEEAAAAEAEAGTDSEDGEAETETSADAPADEDAATESEGEARTDGEGGEAETETRADAPADEDAAAEPEGEAEEEAGDGASDAEVDVETSSAEDGDDRSAADVSEAEVAAPEVAAGEEAAPAAEGEALPAHE